MVRRTAGYAPYISYLTAAMDPTYTRLGYYPNDATDSLTDVLLRSQIVSSMCELG